MKKLFTTAVLLLTVQSMSFAQGFWVENNTSPFTNLWDADAVQPGMFVVVGGGATLFKSTDAGTTWNKQSIVFEDEYITAFKVSFPTAEVGYVSNTSVFKTTDGGDSWAELLKITNEGGHNTGFSSMSFADENNGIGVGIVNTYLRTSDGGSSWHRYIGNCLECDVVEMVSDSVAYIGGQYTCGNSGLFDRALASVNFVAVPVGAFIASSFWLQVYSVHVEDDKHLWAAGSRKPNSGSPMTKSILFTTNGGETWLEPISDVTEKITAIVFLDLQRGYYGTEGGDIYTTNDGGTTWTLDYDGEPRHQINDLVTDGSVVVAACNSSRILSKQVKVGVGDNLSQAAELTVYPNPSSGNFTIASTHVISEYRLVDALGRSILTRQPNASHFTIDTSQILSGSYTMVATLANKTIVQERVVVNR